MKTRILYEDTALLVCFKPVGLAVQSGRIAEPDMVSELKNYLARQFDTNIAQKKPVYLGVVHRLDQPVSGVLVFAKNPAAAADLSRQIAGDRMRKTYRAVVCGGNPTEAGEWRELTDFLRKEPGGGARIARPGEPGAKKARLSYRTLDERDGCMLLEIVLQTGRHHQIRVQFSHAGMPLLGDYRYGTGESRLLSERIGIRTVQLQAVRLGFTHPVTGKEVCFELEDKLAI